MISKLNKILLKIQKHKLDYQMDKKIYVII